MLYYITYWKKKRLFRKRESVTMRSLSSIEAVESVTTMLLESKDVYKIKVEAVDELGQTFELAKVGK